MRQVVLDTETTGLEPNDGHRVIEIGCVEMENRRLTGNNLHLYLNPEREIDAGALAVHGISTEFLADKPTFDKVVDEFLAFVDGAELVIHNAPFDVGFMDHEFAMHGPTASVKTKEICGVLDTLVLACTHFPLVKNQLAAHLPPLQWVDSGEAIARRVDHLLCEAGWPRLTAQQDMQQGKQEARVLGIDRASEVLLAKLEQRHVQFTGR